MPEDTETKGEKNREKNVEKSERDWKTEDQNKFRITDTKGVGWDNLYKLNVSFGKQVEGIIWSLLQTDYPIIGFNIS